MAKLTALVVIYDIRGFSSAAKRISEASFGAFITEAHATVLSHLAVPAPTFVKNLGDGNLIIWELEGAEPDATWLVSLVAACLTAQREYRAVVARQSFDGVEFLPRELGFGIAFGPVTRGDDYYGNAINLAARLQDCARPRGVILDDAAFQLVAARVVALGEPIIMRRMTLKGVGRVKFHWLVRLTRGESFRRQARTASRWVLPVATPLLLFAWIDGGLPVPRGAALRGAIDGVDFSVLRPHDEIDALDARATRTHSALAVELATRFDPKTGRAFPGPGETRDFFAWTDGQMLSALLMRPLATDAVPHVTRDIDQLFGGQVRADGSVLLELIEGKGWLRHPTEQYPHPESTAWVLLALVLAHAQPALVQGDAAAVLADRSHRAWTALRGFFDPVCGGWHWRRDQATRNVYGEPEPSNEHYASAYNTILATWVLVEARRLGVALDGRDAILKSSVAWLVKHWIPAAGGWGAQYYPSDAAYTPNEPPDDYRDGLSWQIYAVLMAAERWAPESFPDGHLPDAIVRSLHERVIALEDRSLLYPTSRHKWVVNVVDGHQQPHRVRDMVDFFWIPWAWASARLHLELHARTTRQRVETLRALTRMSTLTDELARANLKAEVFSIAELAIGLTLHR